MLLLLYAATNKTKKYENEMNENLAFFPSFYFFIICRRERERKREMEKN